MELNTHLAEKLLRQLSAVTTHQLGIIRTDGIIAAHTSYNNNYGLRRGSQPRLFPSQSRSC